MQQELEYNTQNNIRKAIYALNKLIKYYQESENFNNDVKVTIEMKLPWEQRKLWNEDIFGIDGTVVLKSSSNLLVEHPLWIALKDMGFRMGTNQPHSDRNNIEYRGLFFLFNPILIAQVFEKCHSIIIEENPKSLSTLTNNS